MQVKKFEAPTIQEALKVIKQEMGPDAIILSTKENKKGFGLMKGGSVEVTAAVSKRDLKKKVAAERLLPNEVKQKIWEGSATTQKNIYDDYFERQLREKGEQDRITLTSSARKPARNTEPQRYADMSEEAPAQQRQRPRTQPQQQAQASGRGGPQMISPDILRTAAPAPRAPAPAAPVSTAPPFEVKALEQEIDDLKAMVKQLASTRTQVRPEAFEDAGQSEELIDAYQHLVSSGVEKRYARELVKSAEFELGPLEKRNPAAIHEKLAVALMERLLVTDALKNVGAAAGVAATKFVAIVGPTGVGKTTTAAKIASQAFLDKKMRVGLINLDSYRVAAADQLATYAKLMNCPFRSAANATELQQAIHDFSSLDLVIIDTTGRSQKDQTSLAEMKGLLGGIKDLTTLLAVSATTKETDVNDIIARFKIFAPEGLIFSKLDETSMFGPIFNVQLKTGLPLAFFTVGQRVPEDIERASAERLADLILDL